MTNGRRNLQIGIQAADQGGFTLTELLVAMAIAGLVFVGVYQMYISSVRTTAVQEQVTDMQQTARVVLDQISRELRLAGLNPARAMGDIAIRDINGASMVDLKIGNRFHIYGDFNGNNTPESVYYDLDVTDPAHPWLIRKIDEPGNPYSNKPVRFGANIENLTATFYDKSNVLTTDNTTIRRVTLTLTARTDKPDLDFTDPSLPVNDPNRHYRRRMFDADVILRNQLIGADTTPPPCPTNVAAVAGADCKLVTVTWNRPSDPYNDLAGYYIYYDQNPINISTSELINITDKGQGVTNYTYSLSVPVAGSWNFAVTSYDKSGNLCDFITSTTPKDPVPANGGTPVSVGVSNITPAEPASAQAVPSDSQVTIDWGEVFKNVDNSDANDLVGYRLYRSASSGPMTLIADEYALPIRLVVGGGQNTQTTHYEDNNYNTFSGGAPAGPINCSVYSYQVTVVDNCGKESAPKMATTIKPDGTSSTGVLPPDNGKLPPAPTMTLVAGDDSSSILVNWAVPAAGPGESTPVRVEILYHRNGTTGGWSTPLDIPLSTLPATGQQIINGLDTSEDYEFYVVSYDDLITSCGDSKIAKDHISTDACAPRLDPLKQAHRIYPGVATSGTPLPSDGSAQIGYLSPSLQQYMTWLVDPEDCTPDSTNFGDQGFDYSDHPTYVVVASNAQVKFYINDPGGSDQLASAPNRYGLSNTGGNPGNSSFPNNSANVDYSPRGGDLFYHYPFDPIKPGHLDSTLLCDGAYDFKVTAQDGELYTSSSTLRVQVKNGGIELDTSKAVTTDISTSDDDHHYVRLGIKNSNPLVDYKLIKISLKWDNSSALLSSLQVFAADKTSLIGSWDQATGTPAGRAESGTELTLTLVPTLLKADPVGTGDDAYLVVKFVDSSGSVTSPVDMRDQNSASAGSISMIRHEQQDVNAAAGDVCAVTTGGSVTVRQNPKIVPSLTVQDKPSANTAPTTVPRILISPSGGYVTVKTDVVQNTVTPVLTPNTVKAYFLVDSAVLNTPPARPMSPNTGGSYNNTVVGIPVGGTDTWNIPIVAATGAGGAQIWYFIEAMNGTATDAFNRNFDLHPDSGVFTYVQCGTAGPTVSITAPSGNSASGTQTVNATITTSIPLKKVQLTVIDDGASPNYPEEVPGDGQTKTLDMCFGTDTVCSGTDSGATQYWTVSYKADNAQLGKTNIKHTIKVTAEDVCGHLTAIPKNVN